MTKFGKASNARLDQCHPDLQRLFREVVKYHDCTVICGHRGKEEQEEAFRTGRSKLRFPRSKHNKFPALAVDVVPYPIDWKDTSRFYFFAGYVLGVAQRMGINIRWGGDFNRDLNLKNDSFIDMPHFELVIEEKKNANTK